MTSILLLFLIADLPCSVPAARGPHLPTSQPKMPKLLPSSWPSCRTPSRPSLLNSRKWRALAEAGAGVAVMVEAEDEAEDEEADEAEDMAEAGVADMVVVEAGTGAVAVADGKQLPA